MNAGIGARIRTTYQQTSRFFSHEIWNRRLEELPTGRARLYSAARILYCTLKSLFWSDTLQVRAAALTYFTVLSIVPLLAFAFALLKGFGAYDVLIDETIRPYVLNLLAGNEALRSAFEQILGFVEDTGVTSLGFIGLLTLLYAATRLLRNIEGALNEIWGATSAREALQQLRDYVAIIVVTPICLMAAAGLTTAGQAFEVLRSAGETLGVSELMDQLVGVLGPLVVLFLGLLFLYKVMPHTNVKVLSAVLGAAIGGLLWYLVLIAHVRFQVGVAQYNALYSSFAAVPIFLAWLQISWTVVLVGAEIAATHQNSKALAQRTRIKEADQASKEAICMAAALRISGAFLAGQTPLKLSDLSAELDVPEGMVSDLIEHLVKAGIVVKASEARGFSYVLGRPAESIRVKDVLDAVRHAGADASQEVVRSAPGKLAARLWAELDQTLADAACNRTLREIVEHAKAAEPSDAPVSARESELQGPLRVTHV